VLIGGAGRGTLEGGHGADTLDGESDDNTPIICGGAPTSSAAARRDTIWSGFNSGRDDCGEGIDILYAVYLSLGRLSAGRPSRSGGPSVREPWRFHDGEASPRPACAASRWRRSTSTPNLSPKTSRAARNAGLEMAGPPGADAITSVDNNNAEQPLRRHGAATAASDSLSVRSNGGRSLAPANGLYGLAATIRLAAAGTDDRLFGAFGNDGLYGPQRIGPALLRRRRPRHDRLRRRHDRVIKDPQDTVEHCERFG
jgi:Ca2+-binding RTX toxin-like protein